MRKGLIAIGLCTVLLMPGCSLFRKKQGPGPGPVIRYMNLKAVYDFVLNRDPDALKDSDRHGELLKEIRALETAILKEEGDREELNREYDKKMKRLLVLDGRVERHKRKILLQINRAVTIVSKNLDIDYVLNFGEDTIYAKKEFDITEDVIREILKIEKRTEPVSR